MDEAKKEIVNISFFIFSTGSMLALSLEQGKTLSQCFFQYWDMKRQIFLEGSTMKRLFGNQVRGSDEIINTSSFLSLASKFNHYLNLLIYLYTHICSGNGTDKEHRDNSEGVLSYGNVLRVVKVGAVEEREREGGREEGEREEREERERERKMQKQTCDSHARAR